MLAASEVKKRGLKGKVRALKSDCMDLCEKGPNVMKGYLARPDLTAEVIRDGCT